KYLLAGGVGLWSLATFGSGMAHTFAEMLLARSLMGIGEATYAVIAPTLIADLFPRKTRSRALAFFYLAIPIGAALGYVIGGWVHAVWGWRWAFRIVGLPGIAVALAALALREPNRGASEEVEGTERAGLDPGMRSLAAYASLFRNRSYVWNTLAMAMMTFALGGLQLYTPDFLEKVGGMDLEQANYWLGPVLAVSGLVGTGVGGWLGDWLARRIRGAYFWMAGIAMLASVPFIAAAMFLARDTAAPALIFASMGIGLTLVFLNTGPSNAIITNVTVPQIRAAAFAINIFFIHLLGDIPSQPVMGWVSDQTGMFWGLSITLPALALSSVFYCMGARYLEGDQEAVVRQLRTATP
ncbi:MAG: MFS transporter, partial [Planctomycetes bacterium]|nr:MFS transporter [Planctomycetota bacterium]